MGRNFTIAEKRMEAGQLIEILSYPNYPYELELYKFVFINGHLEDWHQELVSVYRVEEIEKLCLESGSVIPKPVNQARTPDELSKLNMHKVA